MGLYRRRDKSTGGRVWWISYMLVGRQHRESSGSTNKRVAEKLLAVRKAQVFEDRWNLPKSQTPQLGNSIKEFLTTVPHENTRARYDSSLKNVLRYFGPRIHLSEITPQSICALQQKRLADGASRATANRDVAALSAMLSRAKRLRLISRNPCSDVGRLNEKRDRRQAKPLSYAEEARIKSVAPLWFRTLMTLLVETGLRVKKEALPLRWSDVQLDSEPAWVHVRESKSAAGVRVVWLTKYCRDVLISWRQLVGPEFSLFVFPSPRNPAVHVQDYKGPWNRAAKSVGLVDRRIYDLRSTFASRANACRASGLTVAHLLGHASTQILPTYVKPLDENTKAVIKALDLARASNVAPSSSIQ